MVYFSGNAQAIIDGSGRVALPALFRHLLPETEKDFRISFGPDYSLHLRRECDYEDWVKILLALPNTKENWINRERLITKTHQISLDDKQNRFLIPSDHRTYASLEKEVIFSGDIDKIVLWNPETYTKRFGLNSEDDYKNFNRMFYEA